MVKHMENERAESPFQDADRDIANSEAMQAIISELGFGSDVTGIKVQLWKLETGEPEARVWEGTPEDYDLMRTAREFGSGDYRIKLRAPVNPDGSGQIVNKGSRVERVKLTYAEEQAIIRRAEAVPVAIAAPSDQSAGVVAALAPVLQQIAAAVTQRPDPMEQLKAMAEVFKAMQPAPAAPAIIPHVERADPMDGIMETFGRMTKFRMVKGLMGEMGLTVNEEGEVEEMDILKQGLDMFRTVASAANKKNAPPVEKDVTPPTKGNEMFSIMDYALGQLESAAEEVDDVEEWAEKVYKYADEKIKTAQGKVTLESILRAPDWFAALKGIRPTLATHEPWITQVRNRAIQIADDEARKAAGLTEGNKARKSPKGKP